jgi:hypothetical protein
VAAAVLAVRQSALTGVTVSWVSAAAARVETLTTESFEAAETAQVRAVFRQTFQYRQAKLLTVKRTRAVAVRVLATVVRVLLSLEGGSDE